jgi:hypothetical protein
MAIIAYQTLLTGIVTRLQTELASFVPAPKIFVGEIVEMIEPREAFVVVTARGRAAPPDQQSMAAGRETRYWLQCAILAFRYAIERDQAYLNMLALTAEIERALMVDRTFGGLCNSAWLDGGSFDTIESAPGTFYVGSETLLTVDIEVTV